MAFDGLITKAIVTELNNTIVGGKINKIYEPNKNEIILDIYNKKKFLLNICIDSTNCRINLTNHLKDNPKVALNFCMLLRKYLNGAKIISIDTYHLDRIVIIELESYNELNDLVNYKLIIELMGKHSNIIFINKNNVIIDSIRHIYSNQALRNILPANPYTFPPSNKLDLLNIKQEDFIHSISEDGEKNLINNLQKLFTGISNPFMHFTLRKLNISAEKYTSNDLIKLYVYFQDLILLISKGCITCEEFEFNSKKDFTITPYNTKISSTYINYFIDKFYYNKENEEIFINYRNNVLKLILSLLNKYNKKLLNIQEKIIECQDMDKYKLYGELITSNLYRINNNINIDNIKLENYYNNNLLITIPLDKKISPSLNAKKYFKKYNKLKNTLNIITIQKSQIQSEISYLETIVYALENCKNIEDVNEIHEEIEENILKKSSYKSSANKSKQKSTNILSYKIDGFEVYVGKNNTQNDIVTFKISDKDDVWFHVQGFHGSHVILKTKGNEITDDNPIIIKCAKLAALHSKASNEKKVLVDYTLVKNLKKPKGSKPGFVVFNNHKTTIVSLQD